MDPLSFLYIALGVSALLIAIFLCATLIYLIQILRDVTRITDNISATADRVNDYLIQPFAFLSNVAEYIKPMIEMVKNKRGEIDDIVNEKVHQAAKKIRKKMKEMGDE